MEWLLSSRFNGQECISFITKVEVKRIYVGDAQKYETERFYPIFPPDVLDDPEEFGEGSEPNPPNTPPNEVDPDAEGEEGAEGEGDDGENDEEQ